MMQQTVDMARELAKDMVRIERKIQGVIENNLSNFDVWEEESEGWIVQTSYCQMGGCLAGFIRCDSEEQARKISAKMHYFGHKPNFQGLCSSCRADMY